MRNGKHGAIGRYLASPVAFLARQLKRSAPGWSSFPSFYFQSELKKERFGVGL